MPEETPDNFAAVIPILNQQSIAIAEMGLRLSDLARDVATVSKLLLEGNGRASLMERVALVERTMGEAVTSIRELTKAWELRAGEAEKGKWNLLTSVVCALLTLAGVVFTAIVALTK